MSEETHKSSVESVQESNDSMKIMLVMLAAVTVAVGGVLGLIRGSEALMLAITLPVAAIGLVFVLRLMLQLTSEGEEPDPDVVP